MTSETKSSVEITAELNEAAGEYAVSRETLGKAIKRHQLARQMTRPNAAELGDAVDQATAQTAEAQERVADLVSDLRASGILNSFQSFAASHTLGRD